MLGTLVAICFIAMNITGLTLAGVRDYVQPLFSGLSLVLAIGLALLHKAIPVDQRRKSSAYAF